MVNLKENFKEILIIALIVLLFLTNCLWAAVHAAFIHSYFWSDYSYIDNTNTNTLTNESPNN